VVLLADGDSTAGQYQVVVLRSRPQGLDGGCALVGNDAEIAHHAAQPLQQAAQEEPVGVVDRARWHVGRGTLSGHDQFIAGREKRHPRPGPHGQRGHPDAGREAQGCGVQALAGRKHGCALGHILTGPADPLPPRRHGIHAQLR